MGQVTVSNGSGEDRFGVGSVDNETACGPENSMDLVSKFEKFRLGDVLEYVESDDYFK